ncbi:hypothetical protein ID866_8659 [Astraeus odoratus]|nr:hypothetical protein ID866_8659 [Astraeus odoratus]
MSDNEGSPRKSGYRVEYASSARAKCKGAAISKGELRLGTLIEVRGTTTYAWRHWGCVTPKIISNIKASLGNAEELDGYEELKDEDKERLRRAFQDGKVADADVPATARKPADEEAKEDEKPKKKRAPAKKTAEAEAGDEEKSKKAPAKKPRAKKAAAAAGGDDVESDEKPKKAPPKKAPTERKAPTEKKAAPKKRAPKKKEESEASGEDFGDALGEVTDDDEEEEPEPVLKNKRKVSVFHVSGPAIIRITSLEAHDDYEASFVLKEAKDFIITSEEIEGR